MYEYQAKSFLLCLMLSKTYYAQKYSGITALGLIVTLSNTEKSFIIGLSYSVHGIPVFLSVFSVMGQNISLNKSCPTMEKQTGTNALLIH